MKTTLQHATDTGCGSRLARRLHVASDPRHITRVDLSTSGTGMVPMLLAYQRLVRAPFVRAMRHESSEWRQHNVAQPPPTPQCPAKKADAATDGKDNTRTHMRRKAAGRAQHKWRQHIPRPRASRPPISKQVRRPATRRHDGQLRYTALTYGGMTKWK